MIKNLYKAVLLGAAVVSSVTITGCSSEDEQYDAISQGEVASRSEERATTYTITFNDVLSAQVAGPTSYGANLYTGYGSGQFIEYKTKLGRGSTIEFTCGVNVKNNTQTFSNGGIAISKWNMRSNPTSVSGITIPGSFDPKLPQDSIPSDWWYSYYNQCSVYNTYSTDGANSGAGAAPTAGGTPDNYFGVMYGYQDSYNAQWMSKPSFSFSSAVTVKGMYICNTSYVYGVVTLGNKWYTNGAVSGETKPLSTTNGWFKVVATGYKNGNVTGTVEKYLCDYRNNAKPMATTWEYWDDLDQLGEVTKIDFNFVGSDTGEYGLNTPAYLCIDNIQVVY